MPSLPARNMLDRETSPYLLQHRDNPVHWQAWAPEVLSAAKAMGKPILLSVGYAACHWCHVMAHESFEDAETAALMNDLFVNIKVDREERPDIDAIYQSALHLLGQQGGWPLTMFLTPAGEPVWGGTYFPPDSRYGRPAFRDVLRRVRQVFDTEPATVEKNRTALTRALGDKAQPVRDKEGNPATVALSLDLVGKVAERVVQEVDLVNGGIGKAPKFPQTSTFLLIARAWLRSGSETFRRAVTVTLDRMCQGGIYDHLGGGFARYSTDEKWLVPHFEKMLYDNAQLIELLTLAARATHNPLYAQRVRETAEWVLREMIAHGGGFAATLDADSEGEEGKFYVWTEAEIDAALGTDSPAFKRAYDVTPEGNWEGHSILNRTDAHVDEALLARCRAVLLERRAKRVRPGLDDKVLADWNGMMIAALADAGAAFDEPHWIAAAVRAYRFVRDTLGADGRLRHSWRNGQLNRAGLLDDHVQMARAAVVLADVTGEAGYLEDAATWVALCERHFRDAAHGGYFLTADDAEGLIVRTRHAHDNATPAGNSVLAEVCARLWLMTGETRYRSLAEDILDSFAGELTRNFFPLATLLNAFETLVRAPQIVIVGNPDSADTLALRRAVFEAPQPDRVLTQLAPGAALPPSHPARGKDRVDGRATAYVCFGTACSLPITDAGALRQELAAPKSG
jgi:uncharacterized protein YyaL (SSP411 family)